MANIKICIGISGSGKTTYCDSHFPDYNILCMDDIRFQLTGSYSDQSRNRRVTQIFNDLLEDAVSKNENICISNTNLRISYIKDILKKLTKNYEVELLLFEDSRDWEKCLDRVLLDIKSNIGRSNTSSVEINGMPLIKVMSDRYTTVVENIKDLTDSDLGRSFKSLSYRKI